jgi:spore germination cell wall hydrolase CwlJ-like protein
VSGLYRVRLSRRLGRFGAAVLAFSLLPNQVGFQDLGALLARQPAVGQRWQSFVRTSPGTIQASLFAVPQLVGKIPQPPLYALASIDPNTLSGSLGREVLGDATGPVQFPSVNRRQKGDALTVRPRRPLPPLPPSLSELVPSIETEASFIELAAAYEASRPKRFERYDEYELPPTSDQVSRTPDVDLPYADLPPTDFAKLTPPDGPASNSAQLYFGVDPLGSVREALAPWKPGEAPEVLVEAPQPELKLAALPAVEKSGETVARKGEVTGAEQRPMSPAERLHLSGVSRAKAEKCLANAVYFESRGEVVRGQIAVAQVVMNRVFTPFYPKTVCDVVYQNAHRHNSCQFTFACDGIPDVVTEPDAWVRAKRIAADTLDGKLWMPEVAKATHYHAYWVRPSWVGEMRRILKLGVHTFYRPLNWGDGSDEPTWGDAKTTAEIAAKL